MICWRIVLGFFEFIWTHDIVSLTRCLNGRHNLVARGSYCGRFVEKSSAYFAFKLFFIAPTGALFTSSCATTCPRFCSFTFTVIKKNQSRKIQQELTLFALSLFSHSSQSGSQLEHRCNWGQNTTPAFSFFWIFRVFLFCCQEVLWYIKFFLWKKSFHRMNFWTPDLLQ